MTKNSQTNSRNHAPETLTVSQETFGGHASHWGCLTQQAETDVVNWLQTMLDTATVPQGLNKTTPQPTDNVMLISGNQAVHVNQVLQVNQAGTPTQFVNAFPCVNSPYGRLFVIERIISNNNSFDAVLKLRGDDNIVMYAYDQLHAVNKNWYNKNQSYYVNLSGLAYQIEHTDKNEVLEVTDAEAIRYHRALNAILADNDGVAPENLQTLIEAWQPQSEAEKQPVTINLGNMCAYLFGNTLGQEDEAWCQGQVLGMQTDVFFDKPIKLLDVAILREPETKPVVIRVAALVEQVPDNIQVGDFIHANIWIQAAIYASNNNN